MMFVLFQAYYTTDVGITEFGFVLNLSVVVVVSLHLAVETLHWVSLLHMNQLPTLYPLSVPLQTIFHHVILWGSVVVTITINYIYTAIDSRQSMQDTLWIMQHASTRAEFWLVLLVTPLIALIPRLVCILIHYYVRCSPFSTLILTFKNDPEWWPR